MRMGRRRTEDKERGTNGCEIWRKKRTEARVLCDGAGYEGYGE